jgi:transposase
MPKKVYVVELTTQERQQLTGLVRTGRAAAYKRRHAEILLKADTGPGGPAWTDARIAEALDVGTATVERLRQRFVTEGLEAALGRRKAERASTRRLDGDGEAKLIALACSEAPEGYARWTLRLLAERMVVLEYVEQCSKNTVHRALKKTGLSLG